MLGRCGIEETNEFGTGRASRLANCSSNGRTYKATSPDKVTWSSSMPGCALFEDQGRIGMGMVLWDHRGGFLAAKANIAFGPMDVLLPRLLVTRQLSNGRGQTTTVMSYLK